jgi:hypothetical protein
MVKIIENKKTIKLQRGNRIIERDLKQYQDNKAKWDFRGFKPVQDVVKETNIEQPKKKKVIKKKKDVQVDLETDKKELEVAVQKDME